MCAVGTMLLAAPAWANRGGRVRAWLAGFHGLIDG